MMMKESTTSWRRVEALVDGRLAVEGTPGRGKPDRSGTLLITPTYLRAGLVQLDPDGVVHVRAREQRDVESDAALEDPSTPVTLIIQEYSEVWLDGRLAYMSK
jgi:hypothetical protein